MIKVLYFARTSRNDVWEYDFIEKEILAGIEFTPYYFSLDQIREIDCNFDVVVYSCRDPSQYYWGYMPTYDDILECVKKVNPKIVIQLSDEYEHENLDIHNDLCKYCDLMLRQYWHSDKRSLHFGTKVPTYENLVHMPLGYINDFAIERKDIRTICERKYTWSFVGKIKDDQFFYYDTSEQQWKPTTNRQEMIDTFSSKIQNYFFKQDGVSKPELADVTNNSIFVLCGRGNTSLNCFRNYESTLCGAIPVVVYRYDWECDNTFKFNKKPPWIYVSSWEEAAEKCTQLLKTPEVLQYMQDQNFKWWDNEISYIRNRVSKVLNIENSKMQAVIYSNGSQECERAKTLLEKLNFEIQVYKLNQHFSQKGFVAEFGAEAEYPQVNVGFRHVGGLKETLQYMSDKGMFV